MASISFALPAASSRSGARPVCLFGLCYILTLLLAGCGGGGGGGGDTAISKAAWTVMVYMAGDNNLAPAAVVDLNEMEMVGSTGEVNVIVQVEFSPVYDANLPSHYRTDRTYRGRIARDNDPSVIKSPLSPIGNRDMGAKETLSEFIQWTATHFPADNFALVLWDHGAGWKRATPGTMGVRGALHDETSGSFMALADIAEGVRSAGVGLRVLNFDACLMAMHEVAYEFEGLTEYMVFSEESEPGNGDPYHAVLGRLAANPAMSGAELARAMVQEYVAYYRQSGRSRVTKSAVQMGGVGPLHSALTALARALIDKMGSERPNIQAARDQSTAYDEPSNHDLGDFVRRLKALTTDATLRLRLGGVESALGTFVIENGVFTPHIDDPIENSQGLAIFLPRRAQVTDRVLAAYGQLGSSGGGDGWSGFIAQLVHGETGQAPPETVTGNFVFRLEWDTNADLDLLINEPSGTWAAPFLGSTSPNAFLSADSAVSGESMEYYAAAEEVDKGQYDVLVRCYSQEGSTVPTNARLYYKDQADPLYSSFVLIAERQMDQTNMAPISWFEDPVETQLVAEGAYSDWWLPASLVRAEQGTPVVNTRFVRGGKALNIHWLPVKRKVSAEIDWGPQ